MNNEQLEYCLVRDVKEPCRAHPQDAGIDFFVPNQLRVSDMWEKNPPSQNQIKYVTDENSDIVESIILKPGQRVLIPSGVKMKVPDGYMLMYDNKSGVASKKGLVIGAKIVDIGYEGECHLNLINTSNEETFINAGDKICQGILVKIGFHVPHRVHDEFELYGDSHSARGADGFGSTDKVDKTIADKEYGPKCCEDNSTGFEWFDSHFINFKLYSPESGILSVRLDDIIAISDTTATNPRVSTLYLKGGVYFQVAGSYDEVKEMIAKHP